jgi:hypothetical protein
VQHDGEPTRHRRYARASSTSTRLSWSASRRPAIHPGSSSKQRPSSFVQKEMASRSAKLLRIGQTDRPCRAHGLQSFAGLARRIQAPGCWSRASLDDQAASERRKRTFDSGLVGPAVPLRIPGDASSPRDGACRHDGDRLRRRGDGWRGRMRHVPASRRRHWSHRFRSGAPGPGPGTWPYVDCTIARIALGLVGAAPWYRPRRSADTEEGLCRPRPRGQAHPCWV